MSTTHKTQEPGCVTAPTAPSSQVQSQKVEAPSKLSPPQLDFSSSPSRGLAAPPHPKTGVWHEKCNEVSLRDWEGKRRAMAEKARHRAGVSPLVGSGIPRELLSPLHIQEAPIPSSAPSLPPLPPCQGEEAFVWMGETKVINGVGKSLNHPKFSQASFPPSLKWDVDKKMRETYPHG